MESPLIFGQLANDYHQSLYTALGLLDNYFVTVNIKEPQVSKSLLTCWLQNLMHFSSLSNCVLLLCSQWAWTHTIGLIKCPRGYHHDKRKPPMSPVIKEIKDKGRKNIWQFITYFSSHFLFLSFLDFSKFSLWWW